LLREERYDENGKIVKHILLHEKLNADQMQQNQSLEADQKKYKDWFNRTFIL